MTTAGLISLIDDVRDAVLARVRLEPSILREILPKLDAIILENGPLRTPATVLHKTITRYVSADIDRNGNGESVEFLRAGALLLTAIAAMTNASEQWSPTSRPAASKRILIVMNDPDALHSMDRTLCQSGFRTIPLTDDLSAIRALHRKPPVDLLIAEADRTASRGIRLAGVFHGLHPDRPVLFVTSQTRREIGAFAKIILKPFTPATLVRTVNTMLSLD